MCLDSLETFREEHLKTELVPMRDLDYGKTKELVAWKIFAVGKKKDLFCPFCGNAKGIVTNTWLSEQDYRDAEPIGTDRDSNEIKIIGGPVLGLTEDHITYPIGFHCYTSKEDAEDKLQDMPVMLMGTDAKFHYNTEFVVRKVYVRKIAAYGKQVTKMVVVAKEIYVCEDKA